MSAAKKRKKYKDNINEINTTKKIINNMSMWTPDSKNRYDSYCYLNHHHIQNIQFKGKSQTNS